MEIKFNRNLALLAGMGETTTETEYFHGSEGCLFREYLITLPCGASATDDGNIDMVVCSPRRATFNAIINFLTSNGIPFEEI